MAEKLFGPVEAVAVLGVTLDFVFATLDPLTLESVILKGVKLKLDLGDFEVLDLGVCAEPEGLGENSPPNCPQAVGPKTNITANPQATGKRNCNFVITLFVFIDLLLIQDGQSMTWLSAERIGQNRHIEEACLAPNEASIFELANYIRASTRDSSSFLTSQRPLSCKN